MNMFARAKMPHEAEHLRAYGYAPGNYTCICTEDGCETVSVWYSGKMHSVPRQFTGAKRSYRCQPCAQKAYDHANTAKDKRAVRAPQLVRSGMTPRPGINETNTALSRPLQVMALITKIYDEVGEVSRDLGNAAEYGDVLEALMSLAELNGVTEEQVHDARHNKNAAKGRLLDGTFWTPDHFMEPQ